MKYTTSIVTSLLIIVGFSLAPFFISRISFKYYFGILFLTFFFLPLLSSNKKDNSKHTIIKYLIIVCPFLLVMSTTTFLTKNVNAFPLCLAILSGGLLSYKLLEKQFYIKIVVAVLVFYFGYTFYPKYASELSFQKSKVDYPLIENTTLQKQDSSFLNLSNLNDKIIVLEFWNSACGQCIKEFPRFNEFYNKYKNQYNIYSVNIPLNRDKKTHFSPKKLIDSLGYNFPILSMDADSAKKLGIKYYPTAIVIDKNERVKFKGRLTYGAKGRYNFENILKKIKNE